MQPGAMSQEQLGEPWDRVSLAFANSDLDGQFWRARVTHTLCRYDLVVYLYTVVHWAALFLALAPPPATPAFVWVVAYPSLVFLELGLIYCAFHRSRLYVAWRTWLVVASRLGAIFVTAVTLFAPPPAASLGLFFRMASQTPVATSLILGVGLQLPFRLHVAVQFLSCTAAMLLVPPYAASWGLRDPALAGLCRSGGATIDWAVRALLWVGSEGGQAGPGAQCDCCLVLSFLQWTLGFVAPCAFIYCVESHCRKEFVLTHGRLVRRERLRVLGAWRRAVPSAALAAVVGVVVLWELLKATSTLAA